MLRGGGTAGGSASKTNFIVNKPMPKFLQELKRQFVKNEPKLEDKLVSGIKDLPEDYGNQEYDYENAVVVNVAGEDVMNPEEILDNRRIGNKAKEVGIIPKTNEENKQKIDDKPVEIKSFRPNFVPKHSKQHTTDPSQPAESNTTSKSKIDNPEKKPAITTPTPTTNNKDASIEKPSKASSNTDHNNDSTTPQNSKRKLDDYIKGYTNETPKASTTEPVIKKKIKKNPLLSFDDD